MRRPNFQPRPTRPQRGVLRWIGLFVHVMLFFAMVFNYPMLEEASPGVVVSNPIWMGMLIWAMIVLLHFALVILLEGRESLIFAMRERRRRQRYKAMREENLERQRSISHELETRVYDEDDLEPQGS